MHPVITRRRRTPGRSGPLVVRVAAAIGAAALVATTAACAGGMPGADLAAGATVSGAAGSGDVVASGSGAAAPLNRRDVDAWLDETLPAALEANGIAGASVAGVHDGDVVTTRGVGVADTGADGGPPVRADADTLFRPGSVSKVFTATAVMQLVERGELDLDADVSEYLDFEIERNHDADLTLRHLLTHTPGFEERIAGLIGSGEGQPNLREALVTDPPEQVYAPGTTPAYSNYGNALAGYVVQRVSGEPFEDYLDRHVLEPLGMASSTFRQPLPEHLRDRMSQGYVDASGPAQPFEIVGTPPAGALSASANDMARFMLAQLGAVPERELLLRDETREEMYSPALTEAELGGFAGAQRMTLGFFEEGRNGHRIVGHGGDTNVFHSHLQLYPDDGAGIYLSVNSSGLDLVKTHALRTDLMEEFADRYFPATDGTATDGAATDAESGAASTDGSAAAAGADPATVRRDAERVAGAYTSARAFDSTFLSVLDPLMPVQVTARDDGGLELNPDPGTSRPTVYEPAGTGVWQEAGGERRIAVRTESGRVTGITHDAAFTLLPLDGERRAAVPVLAGAAAVLLLGLLAWPVAAIRRRVRGLAAPARDGRSWRVLTRVGVISTLLALAGWVAVVLAVMGFADVPSLAIRGVQALQVIGALGLVPAVVALVGDIRRRAGWRRIAPAAVTLLALSAVMNVAIMFHFLSPDISY